MLAFQGSIIWSSGSFRFTCVKSRKGFINFAECPVLWQSKLQTKTALFMMEAKIIALSGCCRELLAIIIMVRLLAKAINLLIGNTTMNVSTLMKTIREHWCWPRLCLHSFSLKQILRNQDYLILHRDFQVRYSTTQHRHCRTI